MGEEELYTIEKSVPENPVEELLRMDRIPHIWCPGCGIGTTVNCFARALEHSGVAPVAAASDILAVQRSVRATHVSDQVQRYVYRIVEEHGGRLTFQSEAEGEGHGTIFQIALPLSRPAMEMRNGENGSGI